MAMTLSGSVTKFLDSAPALSEPRNLPVRTALVVAAKAADADPKAAALSEFRKTLQLAMELVGDSQEFDPLEQMLTR